PQSVTLYDPDDRARVTGRIAVPRISLDPPKTPYFRIGSWFLRRQFGTVLDPFRVQGHNMAVAKGVAGLERGAAKWTKLDQQLRDLADLATAVKIGCPWCMDFGYWVLHTRGMPRAKIEAVAAWRESPIFDSVERLVMEYAEAMTETPPAVDDELVRRLRAHLGDAQLVHAAAIR